MRMAAPLGQPAQGCTVIEAVLDGWTVRTVQCLDCRTAMSSSDHWSFGVMEELTHVAALRGTLGETCTRDHCLHADGLGTSAGGRPLPVPLAGGPDPGERVPPEVPGVPRAQGEVVPGAADAPEGRPPETSP